MKPNQRYAMKQIDLIAAKYCESCALKAHFTKQHNKHVAHHYCIKKCSIGMEIKQLGNALQ